jgi:hypothetical protein
MVHIPRPVLLVAMTAAVLGLASAPVSGAVWDVTLCTDTVPGGAPGELRRAIQDAEFGDVIRLPACVITLGGGGEDDGNQFGDLDIECPKTLFIEGAGAGRTILDGGGRVRILDIHPCPFTFVRVSGVTMRGGKPPPPGAEGGAVRVREASFELLDSALVENEASGGGAVSIASSGSGTLLLRRSTITRNKAGGNGGGGIRASGVSVAITDTTVADNEAGGLGGGVLAVFSAVLLEQSTVSGNGATGPNGGGGLALQQSSARATLLWSTVTNNLASAGPGGGLLILAGPVAVASTILAGNHPDDCGGIPLTSAGHNLQGDGSCTLGTVTDLVGDPLLGPLADNGGPTPTHALLPGSLAVDQGGDGPCPPADQRGLPRPQGASCDAGAVERRVPTGDRSAGPPKPVDPRTHLPAD